MDPNRQSLTRLLAAILDSQIEDGKAAIEPERLRQALTSGPGLSAAEKRALWLSPATRDAYRRIKRSLNAERDARLERQGLTLRLVAKAAAGTSDTLNFEAEDRSFSLTLYRQPDADMPWMVLLRLGEPLRRELQPTDRVRLIDDGGLEWVSGFIDRRGELSFGWFNRAQGPDERLRSWPLRLDVL